MRAGGVIVVVCGCGRIAFDPTDAPAPDAVLPRCDPTQPFGPLTPLTQLSSPQAEIGLELAADGLSGFLWSDRSGVDQIYEASRTTLDEPFQPPRLVTSLSMTGIADRDPCPTGDGLAVVFASLRPGGGGGDWDLWLAHRPTRDAPFEDVDPLTTLNGPDPDWGAFVTSDGRALYYVIGADLVVARRQTLNDPFSPPQVLASLTTNDAEFEPAVTPDELTILWASSRPDLGAKGGLDIFMATRPSIDASFVDITNVAELNTGGDDIPAWISPDLCEIHVTQSAGASGWDLYHARRP